MQQEIIARFSQQSIHIQFCVVFGRILFVFSLPNAVFQEGAKKEMRHREQIQYLSLQCMHA